MNPKFTLKEEHLKLLTKANWYWKDAESGAPAVDPKRPYGNSGVARDVAEILDRESERCPHCNESLEDNRAAMMDLHKETLTALQVILSTRSFALGEYVQTAKGWEFVR